MGNVLATVSDKKFGVSSGGSLIDYYVPDIVNATDYYPFGMPSRVSLSGKGYRFGFNGKENDNDVEGWGNQQDYGMRTYDPRVGRFLSVDPINKDYPWYTPYQFAGNTPIQAKDLDGLEPSYPYMNSKGQWMETPAGDNLNRGRIPEGHQQFARNSVSLPSEQQLREQWAASLNFVPFVGEFKGVWEGVSGEEWFTGRKLSSLERKMALLPVRVKAKGVTTTVAKGEVRQIVKEEAVATTSSQARTAHNGNSNATATGQIKSEFLGGAKGDLMSKRNILEAHHVPSMNSYELAGFKISYNEGSALQMLYEEHRAFVSTGRSEAAVAFRNQEASMLKQGDYMGAFELNARRIQETYGNKYNKAIGQAREEYRRNIIPQMQQQTAQKTQ